MDIQGHNEGFSTHTSFISWNFVKPFILEIGLISSHKMPPCLLCYLIRALCILIWLELDSPYWSSWLTQRISQLLKMERRQGLADVMSHTWIQHVDEQTRPEFLKRGQQGAGARIRYFKSTCNFIIKGYHGKIVVYLERVHQYICPVKFLIKIPAVLRNLCPCAQSPMCPIAHVPHHPCAPSPKVPQSLSAVLSKIPLLPMCSIGHVPHYSCALWPKLSKKMSNCQKDVKL